MKNNYNLVKTFKKEFIAFSIIVCCLFVNLATAQKNIGWTGATNNNWDEPTNWNYPAVTSVATYANNVANITLTAANADITVGDKVAGYGIPYGATITAIDGTQKIITLSSNTIAVVGTPGTNVVFTFATPKSDVGPPSVVDIALINNGGNPTLSAGAYTVAGLTVGNETGAITGSTLTIPVGVDIYVESATNEAVLLRGGNIVNNGTLNIINYFSGGSNNTAGAYGMTFALPAVVPTVATEYTYSGTGLLSIDTFAGNNFSGGFLFNGTDANAGNATYKLLFNGTTSFSLSTVKSGTNTALTQLMRAVGIGTLQACKVIIGGTGFDLGDISNGSLNGLIAVSGGGVDVTFDTGTTINVFSAAANPMALLSMYVFGATSIPAYIKNKGTLNFKGSVLRSPISASAQNNGIVNLVNDGTFDMDVNSASSGQGGIAITNNGSATLPADVIVTNNGTMTVKTMVNGVSWGAPINMTTFSGAPNLHIINTGTLNLFGSNYSFGAKVFNPLNIPVTQTGTSRITNSGILNTNQELRVFYTVNSAGGKITFASDPAYSLRLATFTVGTAAAATLGSTYTDSNSNVHTVVLTKVTGTGTTLVTHFASNAINPLVTTYSAGPPEVLASALTNTSGTGDASIVFTALTTNNDNALFQTTLNSGTINTNTGTSRMTGVSGITTPDATSVLSPGGDTGNGLMSFGELVLAASDLLTLRGTLKMQATGSTSAGVDYDVLKMTGAKDVIDISTATLDVTGLYTPAVLTTIDIITTNTTEFSEGGVSGEFASVVGLPAKWTVVYTGGLGGKVQLVYDPTLGTDKFSTFKFSAYPNPTSDQVNLSAAKTISKVELFNLLGQRVLSNTVNANQKQLSISNLQNGVYLMEVTIDNAKQAYKIIKQ
jgi:trimeric autotransporter adhesin